MVNNFIDSDTHYQETIDYEIKRVRSTLAGSVAISHTPKGMQKELVDFGFISLSLRHRNPVVEVFTPHPRHCYHL